MKIEQSETESEDEERIETEVVTDTFYDMDLY